MTPEGKLYLEKARQCLSNARAALRIGLTNDAARNAYLAAFHTAQAYVFTRTEKIAKTHSGVRSMLGHLPRVKPQFDASRRIVMRARPRTSGHRRMTGVRYIYCPAREPIR